MGESPAPGPRRSNLNLYFSKQLNSFAGTQSVRNGLCLACPEVVAFFYCPELEAAAPPGRRRLTKACKILTAKELSAS